MSFEFDLIKHIKLMKQRETEKPTQEQLKVRQETLNNIETFLNSHYSYCKNRIMKALNATEKLYTPKDFDWQLRFCQIKGIGPVYDEILREYFKNGINKKMEFNKPMLIPFVLTERTGYDRIVMYDDITIGLPEDKVIAYTKQLQNKIKEKGFIDEKDGYGTVFTAVHTDLSGWPLFAEVTFFNEEELLDNLFVAYNYLFTEDPNGEREFVRFTGIEVRSSDNEIKTIVPKSRD